MDSLYSYFAVQPEQELPYFVLIDGFLSVMKILYENLDVKNRGITKESNEPASLKDMITYIDRHLAQRIMLENIALSVACCKSRCSQLFKKYLREPP